jgi:ketosteroid isomerase-like protein
MRVLIAAGLAALTLIHTQAQTDVAGSLQELVDTERAFAAAAQRTGWRAAFIDYFADDAITFTPYPTPMQPRLRSQPNRPAAEHELVWEPRTGDVAVSGDIGWLTGPSTFVDHTTAGFVPEPGNYFSIWKRQRSGQWRVYIDIGTKTPEAAPFAAGFVRAAFEHRDATARDAADAVSTAIAADRALNNAITDSGAAAAYGQFVTSATRLHRNGTRTMPAIGAMAIAAWLEAYTPRFSAVTGSGEASRAGDLALTYGRYQLAAGATDSGAYVRMWARRDDGKWLLQIDATVPAN